MNRVVYRNGEDLKIKIKFNVDGSTISPASVPFDLYLWTIDKATAYKCGYTGAETYGSIALGEDSALITIDANNGWLSGEVNAEVWLNYPDSQMPDKVYTEIHSVSINDNGNEFLGEIEHMVYGLSAYDLAVKNGFIGSITDWLNSLKGDKGNTLTWDDLTEEQKESLKGKDGYTPQKGVDYFDGEDGRTPIKGVDYFDGYTPQKGIDYFDGKDGKDGYLINPRYRVNSAQHLIVEVPDGTDTDNLPLKLQKNGHLVIEYPESK